MSATTTTTRPSQKNILSEQEIAAQNNVTCESLSSSDDRANINSTSRKSSDDFLFRLTIDELGKAVLSSDILLYCKRRQARDAAARGNYI